MGKDTVEDQTDEAFVPKSAADVYREQQRKPEDIEYENKIKNIKKRYELEEKPFSLSGIYKKIIPTNARLLVENLLGKDSTITENDFTVDQLAQIILLSEQQKDNTKNKKLRAEGKLDKRSKQFKVSPSDVSQVSAYRSGSNLGFFETILKASDPKEQVRSTLGGYYTVDFPDKFKARDDYEFKTGDEDRGLPTTFSGMLKAAYNGDFYNAASPEIWLEYFANELKTPTRKVDITVNKKYAHGGSVEDQTKMAFKGMGYGELIADNIIGLDNEYESLGEKIGKQFNKDEITFLKNMGIGMYEGAKEFVSAPIETAKEGFKEFAVGTTDFLFKDLDTRLQEMFKTDYKNATPEQVTKARESVLGDAVIASGIIPAGKLVGNVIEGAVDVGTKQARKIDLYKIQQAINESNAILSGANKKIDSKLKDIEGRLQQSPLGTLERKLTKEQMGKGKGKQNTVQTQAALNLGFNETGFHSTGKYDPSGEIEVFKLPDEVYTEKAAARGITLKEAVQQYGGFQSFDNPDMAHDFLGVHVGTTKAAADRHFNKSETEDTEGARTYQLRLKTNKPFLDGKKPWTEKGLNKFLVKEMDKIKDGQVFEKMQIIRRRLAEQGYTHVPYINNIEDKRNISYAMLVDRPEGKGVNSSAVIRYKDAEFNPLEKSNRNAKYAQGGSVEDQTDEAFGKKEIEPDLLNKVTDFFNRERGLERSKKLEDAIRYYLGPYAGSLGQANQLINPIVGLQDAGESTREGRYVDAITDTAAAGLPIAGALAAKPLAKGVQSGIDEAVDAITEIMTGGSAGAVDQSKRMFMKKTPLAIIGAGVAASDASLLDDVVTPLAKKTAGGSGFFNTTLSSIKKLTKERSKLQNEIYKISKNLPPSPRKDNKLLLTEKYADELTNNIGNIVVDVVNKIEENPKILKDVSNKDLENMVNIIDSSQIGHRLGGDEEGYIALMEEAMTRGMHKDTDVDGNFKYPAVADVATGGGFMYEEELKKFAQGGLTMNNQTQMAFALGGEAETRDPVSGNDVPPGSLPVEVRDDIPARLSEGEYIVPADVVRFFGVKFFEDLRTKAKIGLQKMDADGRIGGDPVPPMQMTQGPEQDIDAMIDAEMANMNSGGVVQGYDKGADVERAKITTPTVRYTGRPFNYGYGQPLLAATDIQGLDVVKPVVDTVATTPTEPEGGCPQGYIWNGVMCAVDLSVDNSDDDDPTVEDPQKWYETDNGLALNDPMAYMQAQMDAAEGVGKGIIGSIFGSGILGQIAKATSVSNLAAAYRLAEATGTLTEDMKKFGEYIKKNAKNYSRGTWKLNGLAKQLGFLSWEDSQSSENISRFSEIAKLKGLTGGRFAIVTQKQGEQQFLRDKVTEDKIKQQSMDAIAGKGKVYNVNTGEKNIDATRTSGAASADVIARQIERDRTSDMTTSEREAAKKKTEAAAEKTKQALENAARTGTLTGLNKGGLATKKKKKTKAYKKGGLASKKK